MVVVLASPPSSGGSAFAQTPAGMTGFIESADRMGLQVRTIQTEPYLIEDVASASSALVVVTRLDRPLSSGEADALVQLVRDGGRLLVASSSTHVNPLSRQFGVEFDGHAILSKTSGTAPTLLGPGRELTISPVTALAIDASRLSEGVTLLWETPPGSFLDMNGDGKIDALDRDGPFIAGVRVADPSGGVAVFLGGASFLTNGQFDAGYSDALLRELAPAEGTLVFFEGARAHAVQPAYTAAEWIEAGTRHPVLRPIVLLAVLAIAALIARYYAGAASLEHAYAGDREVRREIARDHLVEGLRTLVLERARERAGLTPQEFERLSPDDRRSLIEAALEASFNKPADTRLLSSLRFV